MNLAPRRRDMGTERTTRTCPRCGDERTNGEAACIACGHRFVRATCETHPERPAVGECVVCGRCLCEACHRGPRTAYLCDAHAAVPVIEGWAQVYVTSDEIEAALIRDNLDAEGLDAQILSQQDHFSFTVRLGDLSPVRVLVPAFQYEAAEAVLRAHRTGRGDLAFACPACGEVYEADQTTCTACGEPLP